mgnify:CR=1 FL=1
MKNVKNKSKNRQYQYRISLQPAHCLVVESPQTAQASPLVMKPGILGVWLEEEAAESAKLASTTKYLDAVFLTR